MDKKPNKIYKNLIPTKIKHPYQYVTVSTKTLHVSMQILAHFTMFEM